MSFEEIITEIQNNTELWLSSHTLYKNRIVKAKMWKELAMKLGIDESGISCYNYVNMAITPITLEEEYRKNPELKKQELSNLREWVKKQPHLPDIPELELVCFLHSCLFSVEFAKRTIENYFTIRTHVPEFFSHRDPLLPALKSTHDILSCVMFPEPTQHGGRVIYMKLYDLDPSHFNSSDTTKYFMMVKDLMMQQYGSGDLVGVLDLEGVTLTHVTKFGIMTLKKIITYTQDAMPLRLKAFHYINTGPYMDRIMSLMRPFMRPELYALVHIHSQGMDSFHQHVEQRILPKDLGGNAPDLEELRRLTFARLQANRDYFLREEKLRVDESRRPGKAKNAGDVFGVEGSFKKLDID